MIKKRLLLYTLFLIFLSCQDFQGESRNSNQTIFFDLKEYFKKETQRLGKGKIITKTVTINGEKEERQINEMDWDKAFSIFRESDINKPAWSDKYQADTTFLQNNSIKKIQYIALDAQLKTQQLDILFDKSRIHQIYILNQLNNALMNTQQELIYKPSSGYSIYSQQKQMMSDEKKLMIEVVF